MRRQQQFKQAVWFALGWGAVTTFMHFGIGEDTLPAIVGGAMAAGVALRAAGYFSRARNLIE
jgi:hypothetical protein